MKKLVFILDALKNTEVSRYKLPFANNKIIIPPFSFEPDAAYLCGKPPHDTNSGTHFWYDPQNSEFKIIKSLSHFIPEKPQLLKRAIKKIILKYLKFKGLRIKKTIGLVPFSLLPYFSFSKKLNIFDANIEYKYQTIFNKLKKENYYYIGVPFTNGNLENIKKNLSDKILDKHDIVFFYIGDLDSTGHKYGSNSIEYREKLEEIIEYIEQISLYYLSKNIVVKKLIFGDHGMVNITRNFNIIKILKKLPLRVKKDYIYFLDSTLARFWFFNDKAKEIIINSIPNSQYGAWITDEEKKKYQINYSHNKFGDAVWWASEGTLILPNFWQGNKSVKGMHGYRDDVEENHTMIIGDFEYESKSTYISMMEVHSILIDFLELEY